MKSYVDDIVVTDPNGEKAILYPNTKQEAVEGLLERLANVEKPDITETTAFTMPNSYDGRLLIEEIGGGESQQGENPNPSYPQEIKKTVVSEIRTHGKQLFDKSAPWKGRYCDVDGTLKANSDFTYFSVKTKIGDTFYQSGVNSGSATACVGGFKDGVFVKVMTLYTNNVVINIDADIDEIRCSVRLSDADTYMLEKGSAKTTYEPYTESVITLSQPIDLYHKGDAQDVITIKQIKKKYGIAVFDGKENWSVASGFLYISSLASKVKKVGLDVVHNSMCDMATFVSRNDLLKKTNQICFSTNGNLNVYNEFGEDASGWKAHLSEHSMTVVYELAEEVIEELPLTDQIALNSLATYDGITYLEFDSEIEPTFEGEYGTSKVGGYTLEGMLAGVNGEILAKSNADRITALEATVVNNI